jgi:ankyrin repeat protein
MPWVAKLCAVYYGVAGYLLAISFQMLPFATAAWVCGRKVLWSDYIACPKINPLPDVRGGLLLLAPDDVMKGKAPTLGGGGGQCGGNLSGPEGISAATQSVVASGAYIASDVGVRVRLRDAAGSVSGSRLRRVAPWREEKGVVMNTPLVTLALLLCVGLQLPASPNPRDAEAKEHIRHLIDSLPASSAWRSLLERGAKGDGIHFPWMDGMRKEGVKLAVFTFEFTWTQRGRQRSDWTAVENEYFADYDRSEPITDEGRLSQIKASGLEQELEGAALARAKGAYWFEYPSEDTGVGYRLEELADNEWLPVQLTPYLGHYQPGTTPLMRAAVLGDVERIKKLIGQGADVNQVDPGGETALMYAAASGSAASVDCLLKAGATVNANPDGNGNALVAAVANNRPKNVEALLRAGADPNSKNGEGDTVLRIATRRRFTEIVQLLKQAGAHE